MLITCFSPKDVMGVPTKNLMLKSARVKKYWIVKGLDPYLSSLARCLYYMFAGGGSTF